MGSGLFNDAKLRGGGLTNAIATDIGGGTSYSLLQTLAEGYKVLQLQGQRLHPYRAFHWITRGNAVALGLTDRIGTLEPGTEADFVVLNAHATPAMAQRMERARGLADELFTLQVMGDDRAVVQTYVAGQTAQSSLTQPCAFLLGLARRVAQSLVRRIMRCLSNQCEHHNKERTMGRRDELIERYASDLKEKMRCHARYGPVAQGHDWLWAIHLQPRCQHRRRLARA